MEELFTPTFFRRLQQLKIRTRRAFLGSRQGSHLSLRKGHGLEFSDYRAYAPGDDFRHIDWGLYGRTDRVYVRQFREEQDLNVLILLDASASMNFPDANKDEKRKFRLASELSLCLAYIALSDGDTVQISLLGQSNSPRFVGARNIRRAMSYVRGATASGDFDWLTEVRAAVAAQKSPGKCFFISDFLVEPSSQYSTLDYLRSRNFDISVLQILSPAELRLEIEPADFLVDSETGEEIELVLDRAASKEYALSLSRHIEGLEKYCANAGIVHLLLSSDEPASDIVLNKLPRVGIV